MPRHSPLRASNCRPRMATAAASRAYRRLLERTRRASVSSLARGNDIARFVGSVFISGREDPVGTGFLVSPRLLMTAAHVLPTDAAASAARVRFKSIDD